MGEKGNITSTELAGAGGAAAVIAGAGTQVTAVFQEAGESIKNKIIDKGVDGGIAGAQEKWRAHREGDEGTDPSADPKA